MRMQHISTMVFTVLFVLAACSGCVSFQGKKLAHVDMNTLQASAGPEKPAVGFDVKWSVSDREHPAGTSMFQGDVDRLFRESQLFSNVSQGKGQPYHISLSMNNWGNKGAASVSGFFSGLTLGLIPAYAKDNYTLTVDVKQGETALKQYKYEDCMKSWIQLFLIFGMPGHTPNKVALKVRENMVLNFLQDLQNDKLLKTST